MSTTINELREKLQSGKGDVRNHYFGYQWLYRKLTIYITYLLIPTGISANQVSLLVILLGLSSSITLIIGGSVYLALLLAYLNILLDGVDGEIARYRNIHSLRGVYLDAINHLAVPGIFLASLGYYTSLSAPTTIPIYMLVVSLGSISWSLLKSTGKLENKIFIGNYLGNEARFEKNIKSNVENHPNDQKLGLLKSMGIWGLRYQLREFLLALVVLLIAQLFNILPYVVFAYSIFFLLQVLEEAFRGYFNIEERVRNLSDRLK